MKSISQRELRNDNAEVIRSVEQGESFLVTKSGKPVAVLRPVEGADLTPGLPISQPASRRVDYQDWPRVELGIDSAELLDDLRDER
ncbi:type II toxin-antitoxin system Phd/YefM family antitoxin [Nocardioides sp. Bht2]|uniref:type II toxin-antitoxin system Phd/YefM family antitoxin n=1 Tax=Nocardioides sp. Bht2 TaxID=3392297 RepID=UPI0039B444F8